MVKNSKQQACKNTSTRTCQPLRTYVSRHQHERVKTSSRTCRGKFNYIFKKWPRFIQVSPGLLYHFILRLLKKFTRLP